MSSPTKNPYPQRNRKRNRYLFPEDEADEAEEARERAAEGSSSGRKVHRGEAPKTPLDKKLAQKLGLRLRTLLKLSKAQRWVAHEWFYANLDHPLFLGQNDFQLCLKESFPGLKTRLLRRVEWAAIRRLMGKPRRCSAAFFAQERAALHAKRQKIRQLQQQQRVADLGLYRDLPANVPLPLVIGTSVTALLRGNSTDGQFAGGLCAGRIDAVDAQQGAYRISFNRPVPDQWVPDHEVLSDAQPEFLPLTSFQSKVRPRMPIFNSPRFLELLGTQLGASGGGMAVSAGGCGGSSATNSAGGPSSGQDDMPIGAAAGDEGASSSGGGTLGGFPIRFLALLVRLSKILSVKKKMVYELRAMNGEAERCRSLAEPLGREFQRQYASVVLELEKLNLDLDDYLRAVRELSHDIGPTNVVAGAALAAAAAAAAASTNSVESGSNHHQQQGNQMLQCAAGSATVLGSHHLNGPPYLAEAREIVERSLANSSVRSESLLTVVAQLLSLMLHLKGFGEADVGSNELRALREALAATKDSLQPENRGKYVHEVEVPVNHVESSLSGLGNLGAFAHSTASPLVASCRHSHHSNNVSEF